jgi:hypothetical protein
MPRREQASFVSADRFVGSLSSCTPPSLPPSWCMQHVARGRSAHFCRWRTVRACVSLPSSPTGRPDQLPACNGACAPGWMCTMSQGAQLSAAMVWFGCGGCAQHTYSTTPFTHWYSGIVHRHLLQLLLRQSPPHGEHRPVEHPPSAPPHHLLRLLPTPALPPRILLPPTKQLVLVQRRVSPPHPRRLRRPWVLSRGAPSAPPSRTSLSPSAAPSQRLLVSAFRRVNFAAVAPPPAAACAARASVPPSPPPPPQPAAEGGAARASIPPSLPPPPPPAAEGGAARASIPPSLPPPPPPASATATAVSSLTALTTLSPRSTSTVAIK